MVSFGDALATVVVATFLVSVAVVKAADPSDERWGDRLRSRFVLGVPWGTIVVIGFVLAVYLFVQGGIEDFSRPVVIPFRAWSYLYPLGMVTAPFAHASEGHLIGNLVATVVAAPIAEYAWSHYPDDRGSASFSSWRTNPVIRAVVVFPLAAIGVGLATSLFSLGPVIGFSGVVYAFVGFALVRYPLTTLVGILGARSVVYTVYLAIQWPIVTATAEPSAPALPGWAQTAVQGHALGLFAGLVLGIVVFARRGHRPDPFRFWIAILFYGFASRLWAIYWFLDGTTAVLFRGPGVVVVSALAIVVTLAVTASDRPFVPPGRRRRVVRFVRTALPRRVRRRVSAASGRLERGRGVDDRDATRRILELGFPDRGGPDVAGSAGRVREMAGRTGSRASSSGGRATRRGTALLVVLLVSGLVAGMGVPSNLFTVDERPAASDDSVAVRDYTVSYAEGVEDPRFAVVDAFGLGDAVGVETSGVIVSSPRRNIWLDDVSKARLAFLGTASVTVGGPGWRESVTASRQGWNPAGNDTVYTVSLEPEGEEPRRVFATEPKRADVRIEGRNVSVVPTDDAFALAVTDGENESLVPFPEGNETHTAHDVTFVREDDTVFGVTNGTRVAVASKEEYQGR